MEPSTYNGYCEGWYAFIQGDIANPYPEDHKQRGPWAKGWLAALDAQGHRRDNPIVHWTNVDLDEDNAAVGIGHVIWFLMESGMTDAAAAVETEFGVSI